MHCRAWGSCQLSPLWLPPPRAQRVRVHVCACAFRSVAAAAAEAASNNRLTLQDCLNGFTELEQLDKANTWCGGWGGPDDPIPTNPPNSHPPVDRLWHTTTTSRREQCTAIPLHNAFLDPAKAPVCAAWRTGGGGLHRPALL